MSEAVKCKCGAVWSRQELADAIRVKESSIPVDTKLERCAKCAHVSIVQEPEGDGSDARLMDGLVGILTVAAFNFASNAAKNPKAGLLNQLFQPSDALVEGMVNGTLRDELLRQLKLFRKHGGQSRKTASAKKRFHRG